MDLGWEGKNKATYTLVYSTEGNPIKLGILQNSLFRDILYHEML
jgi:hypothetical protein